MSLGRRIRSAFYWVPAAILWLLKVRFPGFFVERIGHLLLEPDCLIKEQKLGLIPRFRVVMLASERNVPNKALLAYWRQHFRVVSSHHLVKLLRPFARNRLTSFDASKYAFAISGTAAFTSIQAQWGNRPPLLELTAEDRRRGDAALQAMGLPPGSWFVCVHSREGGYSPSDEHVHSYRNSSMADYMEAMDHIVALGGWCIRMGDPSMAVMNPRPGVIDYANHHLRADWMDLYLSANCRFFLGNTSGAFLMASVFGRPAACANMAPLSAVYPFGSHDIGIPKLCREIQGGRLLSFREIMESPISNFRLSSEFRDAGIEVVDNTPEEIRELAMEQLERIETGAAHYDAKDEELQQRFRSLFKPGHYMYGSASRVGRAFLRKYEHLL